MVRSAQSQVSVGLLIRDPQRTRDRILRAALDEFAAKGFAGARVATIAQRARTNVRMLYHYFGSKEELFRAILRRKISERVPLLAALPADPAEALPALHDMAGADTAWLRLAQWEALTAGTGRVLGEEERRKAWQERVELLRLAQRRGRFATDLDAEQAALSLLALAVFPFAFPQITRLVSGRAPTDPAFVRARRQFLRRLGERLRPVPTRTRTRGEMR